MTPEEQQALQDLQRASLHDFTSEMPGQQNLVRWVVTGFGCPDCRKNEDAEVLTLGDPFPSGATAPPAHLNCTCNLELVDVQKSQHGQVIGLPGVSEL